MTDVVAGRYALVDPIAAGGFGTVWRSFDRKTDRYCAAKLLRQRDAGELLRFVREQSVRLTHPNIVGPYSWAAEDGTVLIASELVAGGSVHTLLGDWGPLSEGTVVVMVGQLLAALQAVHDAELIHRDVKPANLLLHATGTGPVRLALTDFGLTISRRDARLTQVGMVIGTPGYLPPEVLAGGVPPDPRHDLYAVGRLALTLLAGTEPDDPPAAVAAIDDPVLRATVDALLRPDPAERPADAMAAAALLSGARVDERPRTRAGDQVDVLDQLPPLPTGWAADGPVDDRPTVRTPSGARATVVDVPPTAPAVAGRTSATDGSVATPAEDRPAGSPTRGGVDGARRPGEPVVTAARPEALSRTGGPTGRAWSADQSSGSTPAPAARRRPVLVAVATAGVALVAAAVLILPRLGADDPATSPPGTGTTVSGAPVSGSTGTPSVGTTGTGSGAASVAPPAVMPTATAPPTSATLVAGATCTWQQEGDREAGVDEVLVCVRDGADYAWRPA